MSKLTFKEIREKCKSGDKLYTEGGLRYFIEFSYNNSRIVTEDDNYGAKRWLEREIENWTIEPYKPEPKFVKKTVYAPVVKDYICDTYYNSPEECLNYSDQIIGYSKQTIYVKE